MSFESFLLIPGYAPPLPPVDEPTVDQRSLIDGADCKNGHFNDPSAHFCQLCGIAMAQMTLVPRKGIRPTLGVLLFDDSATYRLDADYVIGRDPADLRGGARAIRLTYDIGGVSRQHVRVSLNGWTVRVTDLGSSNGTDVLPPGSDRPTRLTSGATVEIQPGTQINLVRRWFRYESHRSRTGR